MADDRRARRGPQEAPVASVDEVWAMVRADRLALADLVGSFAVEEWSGPTWCGSWDVRHVVAHVVAGAELSTWGFIAQSFRSAGRYHAMNARLARTTASRLQPDQLVTRLRERAGSRVHPPGPPAAMLGEVLVHTEDIARARGLVMTRPPERVRVVADLYATSPGPPQHSAERVAGLHVTASDVDWSVGSGPEVRGALVDLVLAMNGRRPAVERLSGDGVVRLSGRIP